MKKEAEQITNAELESLAMVYVYSDPETKQTVRIEKRADNDWIVVNAEKFVLSDTGDWLWKPIFDHMDDDYLYHTGFSDVRLALVAAKRALNM